MRHETLEQAIVKLWASRGLVVTEINVKFHPRGKSRNYPAHISYRIEAKELEPSQDQARP